MKDNTQKIDVARHTHSELKKLYEGCSSMVTTEFENKLRILDVQVKLVSVWHSGAALK